MTRGLKPEALNQLGSRCLSRHTSGWKTAAARRPPRAPKMSLPFGALEASSGFRVQGSGFRVQGSGFRVQGSGFRV